MLKHFHLFFVTLVFISFIARMVLSEFYPERLKQKWLKITPHVIDTLLLLTGIALVYQGHWLSADYGWIMGKILLLTAYIGLGMVAMRNRGKQHWLAAAGAIACLLYIAKIAISKQISLFN